LNKEVPEKENDKNKLLRKKLQEKECEENCNTNVTLQKEKREEDIKNKKKNIDIKEREEEFDTQALKVKKDLEKINININGLTLSWIKDVLTKHKEKYVKMAMGKAIERNKLDINYINGILKNWLREGYPKTYEEMEFNPCGEDDLLTIKEKPNLRFINFEAREYDYKDLEKKLLGW